MYPPQKQRTAEIGKPWQSWSMRPQHPVLLAKAHIFQHVHETNMEVQHRNVIQILQDSGWITLK